MLNCKYKCDLGFHETYVLLCYPTIDGAKKITNKKKFRES